MIGVCKRKLFLPVTVAAAVVLAGSLAVAQFGSFAPAQAVSPSQPAQQTCSLATVNGTYVLHENGILTTGRPQIPQGPFAAAGIVVFDGRGHVRGVSSESFNGKITKHISFTATYTFNPDCTGTTAVTNVPGAVAHVDLYGLPSGSRVTFLRTDPGFVASGVAEKR